MDEPATMPAGLELDRIVAEALGWTDIAPIKEFGYGIFGVPPAGMAGKRQVVPMFSSGWAAAMLAFEDYQAASPYRPTLTWTGDADPQRKHRAAYIDENGQADPAGGAYGPNIQLAICRAIASRHLFPLSPEEF